MKNTKIIKLILAICIITAIFTGCTENTAKKEKASTHISITDMLGHKVTIKTPVKRIVALTPSDCEILCDLGGLDTLVGRGEYCDYPKKVKNITSVKSGETTNIEQIISLNPQVVLMSAMAQTDEQTKALENAGIKVVVSDTKNIEDVYTSIRLIGKVVERPKAAELIISDMKSTFADIKSKSKQNTGKTIYFEVSSIKQGIWTAGSNTFMNEIANMMGLKNIFEDIDGWASISEEQVIKRNPDYIVTISMYSEDDPNPVKEIKSRKAWQDINAIKNNKVFSADSNEMSRPVPRLANAAKILYSFINEK